MLDKLFRRRSFAAAPAEPDAESDGDGDDDGGDEPEDDGYNIVGSRDRVERSRKIVTGYSQSLGGSVVDLRPESYYNRSLELRFLCQARSARVQLTPMTGDLTIEIKATFRCPPLYVFRRVDGETPERPPGDDEWEVPDPHIEHPLIGDLYLADTRSAVKAQRAIVASLPGGWLERLAPAMETLRQSCVYFDVDRMGAATHDDVLDTAPLLTNEVEAVLGLLTEQAKHLPRA